jgi:hypothetical protein
MSRNFQQGRSYLGVTSEWVYLGALDSDTFLFKASDNSVASFNEETHFDALDRLEQSPTNKWEAVDLENAEGYTLNLLIDGEGKAHLLVHDPSQLASTSNAEVWADEFLKAMESNPSIATNRESMIGWFANAIMAGRDESERERNLLDQAV